MLTTAGMRPGTKLMIIVPCYMNPHAQIGLQADVGDVVTCTDVPLNGFAITVVRDNGSTFLLNSANAEWIEDD